MQIKFTVTDEAARYLHWFARNIIFEKTAHDGARHMMMIQLEKARRKYRREDPAPENLAALSPQEENPQK